MSGRYSPVEKGQRYGKLLVVAAPYKGRAFCWCDCGRDGEFLTTNLLKGHTKSCGCARAAAWGRRRVAHG